MGPVRVRNAGFTLVELMIVVAIISVLAVVSMGAYRKYADRARASEVYAMFGEIRTKEEAYRVENSAYCASSATAQANCASGNEDTVFPALLSSGEPRAKAANNTVWPVGWTLLGLNPARSQLYCGYVAVAGGPTATDWANAGTRGKALFANTMPTQPWWYMSATCDNDGNPATNAQYTSAMNTTSVVAINEGY